MWARARVVGLSIVFIENKDPILRAVVRYGQLSINSYVGSMWTGTGLHLIHQSMLKTVHQPAWITTLERLATEVAALC